MVWHLFGGILGALHVLKEHWGPVERDLAAAHYSMDSFLDTQPLSAFISFILYAPPGTAVFHVINEGWEATTHKISDLIEWVKMSMCVHAENPQRAYEKLDKEQRPGMKPKDAPAQMTIGEYMKLAGLED